MRRMGLVLAFLLFAGYAAAENKGRVIDNPAYLLYVPAGVAPGETVPLLVAFDPSGSAQGLVNGWKWLADKNRMIVMASKKFRNNVPVDDIFDEMVAGVAAVRNKYSIDSTRIIAAGNSGGGMAAHMITRGNPDVFTAVITNCGRIHPDYLTPPELEKYPRGKKVAFLAGPGDFNYGWMKGDEAAMKKCGWQTKWIEFQGGHCEAPGSAITEALEWILGGGRSDNPQMNRW